MRMFASSLTLMEVFLLHVKNKEWTDSHCITAKYKSGYRIYFPYLFIDNEIYSKYMKEISQYFQNETYKNQPEDWKMNEIFDNEICQHDRSRMVNDNN
jgi:hypothetical protein